MAACSETVAASNDGGVGNETQKSGLGPVEAFVKGMTSQVNANDVARIVDLQEHMLSRFEKTNEMLLNFNHLSESRFSMTQLEFKKHIQMLVSTKKDLENVFRRIRILKDKLGVRYPEAFAVCAQVHHVPDDESGDEEEAVSSNTAEQPITINVTGDRRSDTASHPTVVLNDDATTRCVTSESEPNAFKWLSSESSEKEDSSAVND